MTQREIFLDAVRHLAKLCAVAAMTAPKSGGQLFLKGGTPFIETVIVDDRATLQRLADWLRDRGNKHQEAIWFRDADSAEKLDLVLFIDLAQWYPPQYDCGACGFGTCAEFMQARPVHQTEAAREWEFVGPVCQIRSVDLGIAVGSAAKTASLHNVDTRCQTRLAAAARHLGIIESDLAVALP
jgi:uncharacterized ferredoxin-like protein